MGGVANPIQIARSEGTMYGENVGNGKRTFRLTGRGQGRDDWLSWLSAVTGRLTQRALPDQSAPPMLRGMIDVMPSAALAVDEQGTIVVANARAALLFGYSAAELSVLPLDMLVLPSQDTDIAEPVGTSWVMRGAPGSTTRPAVVRKRDGSQRAAQVTSSVSFAIERRPYAVLVIDALCGEGDEGDAGDVASAQEPGVRRAGQALMHHDQASDVGDMAAALAHEVDQPLTAILSNAQAARRFLASTPPNIGEMLELLDEIVSDSTRAHAIIRKMRQFGKREQSELSAIDMGCLVRDVMQLLHRRARERHVALSSHIENGLPMLRGDAVQLQQVLVNLILNAFDAMQGMAPAERTVFVSVGAAPGGRGVRIAIRDCGDGVSDEQMATLFKPFSTSKPNGLGLGLSISRIIVMGHGGHMWAERNRERGMTFQFELPAEGATTNSGAHEPL
ncbi:PAS domain-containing protein [Paraburkholderia tropica]|nr:PAS domain-containing protein [Paraburkholderia tropica]